MQVLMNTRIDRLIDQAKNIKISIPKSHLKYKTPYRVTVIFILLVSLVATSSWAQEYNSPGNRSALTLEAQQLTNTYMKKLKKTLQGSIIASGPAATIKVCSVSTPTIKQSLSAQHGWHVSRTSTRIRNPNNQPDPWELRVLQNFAAKIKKGAPVSGLEETAVVNLNGKPAFRYMKAIPVGNLCLTCHGRKISGSVSTAINDHYPSDQAKGYRKGELRGAFTLYKYLN